MFLKSSLAFFFVFFFLFEAAGNFFDTFFRDATHLHVAPQKYIISAHRCAHESAALSLCSRLNEFRKKQKKKKKEK